MTLANGFEHAVRVFDYQNTPDFSKTFNPDVNTMLLYFLLSVGVLYGSFFIGPYARDSLENLYNKYQERRERKLAKKIILP
jgi:hypothetical protein